MKNKSKRIYTLIIGILIIAFILGILLYKSDFLITSKEKYLKKAFDLIEKYSEKKDRYDHYINMVQILNDSKDKKGLNILLKKIDLSFLEELDGRRTETFKRILVKTDSIINDKIEYDEQIENRDYQEMIKSLKAEEKSFKEKVSDISEFFLENKKSLKDSQKRELLKIFEDIDQVSDPLMKYERKKLLAIIYYYCDDLKKAKLIIDEILSMIDQTDLDMEREYLNFLLADYYLNTDQFNQSIKYLKNSGNNFKYDIVMRIIVALSRKGQYNKALHLIDEILINDNQKIKAYTYMAVNSRS